MQAIDDMALLREYADHNSEAAFAELVSRRIGFVHSAALRQVRDPHLAGEITQAVFIILAQKAGQISEKTILTGWFFRTTRFAALAQMRSAAKRSLRTATIEQEMQMQTEIQSTAPDPLWEQMSPLLDEALASLGETDRQAVLLRFFENKSLAEVGNELGTGEDTARKRVTRALEKLHRYFNKRGVSSTTAILAGAMTANSIHAAPVALAKSVTAVALAKGAATSGSTLTLIKGALKIMVWTKAKTAIAVTASVLLAAGTTTVVVVTVAHPRLSASDLSWADNPKYWELNLATLGKVPAGVFIFRPTHFQTGGGAIYGYNPNRLLQRSYSVRDLIGQAWDMSYTRTILPTDIPDERFDVMSTLPGGCNDRLQQELTRRFNLTAHRKTRETDVFLLKVKNSAPPDLKPHVPGNDNPSWIWGDQKLTLRNYMLKGFFGQIESKMGLPVLDRTGLSGYYDLEIAWKPRPGENEKTAFRRALLEQLGLELVPARQPIEMLVVEKMN